MLTWEEQLWIEKLKNTNTELLAATGVLLTALDDATEKLAEFTKDTTNKETAEAYTKCIPKLADAMVAARVLYNRHRTH